MTSKPRPPPSAGILTFSPFVQCENPMPRMTESAWPTHTPIPTSDGWTVMGEVTAGQQVFDHLGRACTVVEVRPQGSVPVYEVRFDDESVLAAAGKQEWITLSDYLREQFRERKHDPKLWGDAALFGITTRDIRRSLTRDIGGTVKTNHSIPMGKPLRLSDRDLPIDPHLLGVWLGDGSRDSPLVHCGRADEPHYRRIAPGRRGELAHLERKGKRPDLHHVPWRTASVLDPASDAGCLEKQTCSRHLSACRQRAAAGPAPGADGLGRARRLPRMGGVHVHFI